MKALIQSLTQDFQAVVFGKKELEFRVMSELSALLPLLASRGSNSYVEILFPDT